MRKTLFILLLILSIVNFNSFANEKLTRPEQWVYSNLEKSCEPLSKKSDALNLYSKTDLSSEGDYIIIHSKVMYKIIKTTGLPYGQLIVHSNARSKVFDIKGWRFNKSKQLQESIDKDKIKERAHNMSFYDDSKQFIATFKNVEKGDIVAFEYSEKLHRYFKDFSIYLGGLTDTIHQEIVVNGNAKVSILNDPKNNVKQTGNKYVVENLQMLTPEDYSGPDRDRLPVLMLTYDIHKNASWKDFSNDFINKTKFALNLNEKSKSDLSNLFNIKDDKDFILQTIKEVSNNVNYVDIEFGVGGFIPRDCNFVHSKKYGDCKDMAYYAVSILKEKGIKAYPVLARTNNIGTVYPDFVSDQFNHVIMAVELDEQTKDLKNIEIEGKPFLISDLTDRFTPVPLLSSSVEGTYALILNENQSKLVKIPYSKAAKNKLSYDIKINYNYNKTINVDLTETKTGHFYTSEKSFLEDLDKTKKKEKYESWVQSLVPASNLKAYDSNFDKAFVVTDVSFISQNVGIASGKEIYFFPNIVDYKKKPFKKKPRESKLQFSQCYTKEVNVLSSISNDFSIKTIPSPVEMDNKFFSGHVNAERNGNNVIFKSKIAWKVTSVAPEEYKEFRNEYKKFLKSLKAPIVLIEKQ